MCQHPDQPRGFRRWIGFSPSYDCIVRQPWMAFDLGYHSPVPLYEGQSPMSDCHLLPGRACFYDGSGLMADTPWRLLREEGDAAVWKHLEDYYADTFSGVDLPAEVSR